MSCAFPPSDKLYELSITRLYDVAPDKMFRCWTEPELLKQCFTPPPWKTVHVETDLRAGGSSYIVMEGPDGTQVPNRGVYLEVIPGRKIVFTDAYTSAWVPSGKPFFTGVVTFDDEGGKTRYTAKALHWTEEDHKAHEAMGFEQGWGMVADQMAALAKTL